MQYTIQVPKPCHEEWDNMTPEQSGRHCAQCCKTVVDFTNWQPEDILNYVQQRSGTEVCGRFLKQQVDTPIDTDHFIRSVAHAPMPFYRKVAAIFLLAFGMLGMDSSADAQTIRKNAVSVKDTPAHKPPTPMIMGGISAPKRLAKKQDSVKKVKHVKPVKKQEYLQGDVAIEPQPTMGLVAMKPIPPTPRDTVKEKPHVIMGKMIAPPTPPTPPPPPKDKPMQKKK